MPQSVQLIFKKQLATDNIIYIHDKYSKFEENNFSMKILIKNHGFQTIIKNI